MKSKSKLEVMDDRIEAMMDHVAIHSGTKWRNRYITLAHILTSYSERCLRLSKQEPKKGEP